MAEGICLVRAADSVIVHANDRFAELLGYEYGELDGRSVTDITWEDEPGLEPFGEGRVAFEHPDHGRVWVYVLQDASSGGEGWTRSNRGNGGGLGPRWER
jgi:PAS domain S-box-containing protein